MNIGYKIFRRMAFVLSTMFQRVRWQHSLKVDGLLKKRLDTQLFISNGGELDIGNNVQFQKNDALSAVGGIKNWQWCLI